jgi:DNA mismatch repair protein MutS
MQMEQAIVQGTADPDSNGAAQPLWPLSLLWPAQTQQQSATLSSAAVADLALEPIVRALDADGQHAGSIRAVLCQLCLGPETIEYRQEILADLLRAPALTTALQEIMPDLAGLTTSGMAWPGESSLMPTLGRLAELDRYVAAVDRLHAMLATTPDLRSTGLRVLRASIAQIASDPDVVALRAELPAMRELIAEASSVTIGLNLGRDLQPEAAVIVELNRFKFKGARSLLGRLLPGTAGATPAAAPLHEVGPVALRRDSRLYKDLQQLLERATAPLLKALGRYRDISVGPLAALERELAFYTGAATLARRLEQGGLQVCRPEIAPVAERACDLTASANLSLALQLLAETPDRGLAGRLITNDVTFDGGVCLLMVTGPNRGGKTTFCRAIGQAQVLFQCGLFVPGSRARLSPVDGIWTHFPLPEADQPGAGRFDEEVRRLRQIFAEATGCSLVLLNEPLTSTAERDALPIAIDMVRAMQVLGARTILITHLHDLALAIPELNRQCPAGNGILSLIALATEEHEGMRGTFRIVPGVPAGRSYAADIARQHGLTFAQLRQLLEQRAAIHENGLHATSGE